jgi:hypothetical protein
MAGIVRIGRQHGRADQAAEPFGATRLLLGPKRLGIPAPDGQCPTQHRVLSLRTPRSLARSQADSYDVRRSGCCLSAVEGRVEVLQIADLLEVMPDPGARHIAGQNAVAHQATEPHASIQRSLPMVISVS